MFTSTRLYVRHQASAGTLVILLLLAVAAYVLLQSRKDRTDDDYRDTGRRRSPRDNNRWDRDRGRDRDREWEASRSRPKNFASESEEEEQYRRPRRERKRDRATTSDSDGYSSGGGESRRSKDRKTSGRDGGAKSRTGFERDSKGKEKQESKKKDEKQKQSKTKTKTKTETPSSSAVMTPATGATSAAPTPITPAAGTAPLSSEPWVRDPRKRPERPSGRDPAVRLVRDANGNWIRPPMGGKGVSYDGQKGKEASTLVEFNTGDPSTVLYNQRGKAAAHTSRQKGEDDAYLHGKIDGSESPFRWLVKNGKLSKQLLELMRRAEIMCQVDLLDPRLDKEVKREALRDEWIDNLGTVPRIIFQIIGQIMTDKAVDVPAVMAEMATPHPTLDAKYARDGEFLIKFAKHFLFTHLVASAVDFRKAREEMDLPNWNRRPAEEARKLCVSWAARGGGQVAGQLLAGFFVPAYRAKATIRPKRMGGELPPTFPQTMGQHVKMLLDWLRYIGKQFLIARMFSAIGADIGDEMHLTISRRRPTESGRIPGFMADYTLYIPKAQKEEKRTLNYLAYLLERARQKMERTKLLAVRKMVLLGETTMRRPDGREGFDTFNPLEYCRLTLRPGRPLSELDNATVHHCLSNPSARVQTTTCVMPVIPAEMERLFTAARGHQELNEAFARLYRSMNARGIRFNNQPQYHWYAPPSQGGKEAFHGFDKNAFMLLLMLSSKGLTSGWKSGDFVTHSGSPRRDAGAADLDFNYDQMDFISLADFKALKTLALPYVRWLPDLPANHPASAALVLKDSWGLNEALYGPKGVSVVFVGDHKGEREQLKKELAHLLTQRQGSRDAIVAMIRSRVHFRTRETTFPGFTPHEELQALSLKDFTL